ncbi:MAG: DegT/DnrJ/EryC1/StrS family aminotransferase [Desulfobacterales bacterium]
MKVPFLDLKAQYLSIRNEADQAIQQVIDKCAFAGGPFVESFEKAFAPYCQCKEAVGVGSGTDALWIALTALGIGDGDEVITVPASFIATAEAISFSGAKPVFIDVVQSTCNMNPDLIEAAITSRTKAIIPVHLFGQMADMDPIMKIAKKHNLFVIEDACQAHGAEYKGRRAGSIGDAGCFSFYPGKNLGAYGEAGAVVTNNTELAETMRIFRDHGQSKKYYHKMVGWNGRMDGIQGAILEIKLKHLCAWNDARRENALIYKELLDGIDSILLPVETSHTKHVYHIYAIRTESRDELIAHLTGKEISCGIHYPVPIHLQEAYKTMGLTKGIFPVSEKCADEFVSLPMYPELNKDQIEYIAQEIKRFTVYS